MLQRAKQEGWAVKQVGRVARYASLILVGSFLLLPIFLLVTSSLKTNNEFTSYQFQLLPDEPRWQTYFEVLNYPEFREIALRTGWLGLVFAGITTISSSLAGYAFARYQVKSRDKLFFLVIAMMIVPQIVVIIPQFVMFARLHLINTYWPWIFWGMSGTPLYIFLFRQFFLGFPRELEDAAEVDGCGPFRIYLRIFLPNAKPVIATVMIFAFLSVWGDFFTPLVFLNADKMLMGVALANYFGSSTHVLAATVLYILPVVVVFFFAQKNILKGIVTSGLKG